MITSATKPINGLDAVMSAAEAQGITVQQFFYRTFDEAVRAGIAGEVIRCEECKCAAYYNTQNTPAYTCCRCGHAVAVEYIAERMTNIEYRADPEHGTLPSVAWMTWQLRILIEACETGKRIIAVCDGEETTVNGAHDWLAKIAPYCDGWRVEIFKSFESDTYSNTWCKKLDEAWNVICAHPMFSHLAHDHHAESWGDFEEAEAFNATLAGDCPNYQ